MIKKMKIAVQSLSAVMCLHFTKHKTGKEKGETKTDGSSAYEKKNERERMKIETSNVSS